VYEKRGKGQVHRLVWRKGKGRKERDGWEGAFDRIWAGGLAASGGDSAISDIENLGFSSLGFYARHVIWLLGSIGACGAQSPEIQALQRGAALQASDEGSHAVVADAVVAEAR
jgi:hypothetical protein